MDNHEVSPLELLPSDVLSHVIGFSVGPCVPRILRVARCSKTLYHTVINDCPMLWEEMVFHESNGTAHHRLTDDMLAALLRRVDARRVTKKLDLSGCARLVGTGLEPLRHSRVLESVDLRTRCVGEVVDALEKIVLDILKIDDASSLHEIYFSKVYLYWRDDYRYRRQDFGSLERHPSRWFLTETLLRRARFVRAMREERYRQARRQKIACRGCQDPICRGDAQIVPNITGRPMNRCCDCNNYYCRKGSCPVVVRDCQNCGKTSCGDCKSVRQCSDCRRSFCGGCKGMRPKCSMCGDGEVYCSDCFSDRALLSETEWCTRCPNRRWNECRMHQYVACCSDGCLSRYCGECQPLMSACTNHGSMFCPKCVKQCQQCSRTFCRESCAGLHPIGCCLCKRTCFVCDDCENPCDYELGGCGKFFCRHCFSFDTCEMCGNLSCPTCEKMCCECETIICSKPSCVGYTKECTICDETICCGAADCVGCGSTFCSAHKESELREGVCSECADSSCNRRKRRRTNKNE